MATTTLPVISRAELAKLYCHFRKGGISDNDTQTTNKQLQHNTPDSAWIVIDNLVYDVTKFAGMHPGGEQLLLSTAGTDQTKDFWGLHRQEVLKKYQRLVVGTIEGKKSPNMQEWKDISQVPYSEASHMRTGWSSPFYTEKHIAFRKAIREYLDVNVRPWCEQAELDNSYPSDELFKRLGQDGFLAALIGDKRGFKMVPRLPGGLKPEDWDYFMEGIVHEECGRLGSPGATDGIVAGLVISLPLVLNFGFADKALGPAVAKEVLLGNKRMVLAVTEPFAGSDVANIRMTAKKSADGTHYILNGVKKWISSAVPATYFMTLARTGGPGAGGLSYFMVERTEGLETKQISTSYSKSAGTALIIYENVKVPVANLVGGKEGEGFPQAMINFTHERMNICSRMIATTRYVLEEAWKWSLQREVFGKNLLAQPVIRFKLADMSARLEAVQGWYENILYQMTKMSFVEQGRKLSGPVALLKYECTRIGAVVADQTPQILGGRAITQTGMGRNVERFMRTYKFGAILGGSEEVLADQAVKLALKDFPGGARL